MLRVLRRQMRGILWATVILVIPTFIIYYGTRRVRQTPGQKFAGEIYGNKIPQHEYQSSLNWVKTLALLHYGNRFEEVEKFLDFEQEAWQNLVLLEHARKLGIAVSDDELVSFISGVPLFQENGRFDNERYHGFLRNTLEVPSDYFENGIRNLICISKLRNTVTDGVRLSEQELKQYYRYLDEKVRVKYILFKAPDFEKDVNVTEDKIKEYFQTHRDEFKEPEKVKFQHVLIKPEPEKVEVSGEETENYYSRNKADYKDTKDPQKFLPLDKVRDKIEEKIRTRKARDKAEEDGENLLSLLEQGENKWEELGSTETGFLEKGAGSGDVPEPCIETAFTMESGEISNLIETKNGFYLLKLVEKKTSQIPKDYTPVAEKVSKKIKENEASELAKSKADACLQSLKAKKNITTVAHEYSKEVVDSDLFSRLSYVKDIGVEPEFIQAAFMLTKEDPYGTAPVKSGFCVLSLEERKKPDEGKFKEDREKLETVLLAQKKEDVLRDWFKLLEEKANAHLNK